MPAAVGAAGEKPAIRAAVRDVVEAGAEWPTGAGRLDPTTLKIEEEVSKCPDSTEQDQWVPVP